MSCFGSWSRHWHRLRHCGSLRSKVERGHEGVCYRTLIISVAEPPLFWAAPAPEVRGPGADSGSDQIGSAPAPGKKRRLQVAPTPALAPCTNIFYFELLKSELLIFLDHITVINCSKVMFCPNNKAFLFCLPKRCSRSRLKKGGSG